MGVRMKVMKMKATITRLRRIIRQNSDNDHNKCVKNKQDHNEQNHRKKQQQDGQ